METATITKEEKNWGMGVHLSTFASMVIPIPFANIIVPLIIWLSKRNESEFVDKHGKEALNFQISVFIYCIAFVGGFLINLFRSIPVLESLGNNADFPEVMAAIGPWLGWIIPLIFIGLFSTIAVIVAAIQASSGKSFRYPLCIRFIR